MNIVWISWAVAFALITAVVLGAGWAARRRLLGALIDSRGRYSLSRLQVALWTATIVSLAGALFAARLLTRNVDPSAFNVPPTVLGLFAVSAGSTVLATAVKAYKNSTRQAWVAASPDGAASLAQVVLVEEGPEADRLVDVAKLQQLIITVFLVAAYIGLAIYQFGGNGPTPVHNPGDIRSLPEFSGALLALLAISHATYLGGKVPNRGTNLDERPGFSVLDRVSTVSQPRRAALLDDEVAGDRRAERKLQRQRQFDEVRVRARQADGADTHVAAEPLPPATAPIPTTGPVPTTAPVPAAGPVAGPAPTITSAPAVGRAQVVLDPLASTVTERDDRLPNQRTRPERG